ncbi:MAG: hypothetical protein HN420_00535 [Rhodospirillaceae bacterium]|jgi:hypothetical protein|nr:hypothetical protein [Rhodospirillaceae bacterium]
MAAKIARTFPTSATPPVRSLVIREGDFLKWLEHARPGDRLEYHRGHLGADREAGSSLSDASRRELVRIADRAMELALDGRLQLVQERRGKDVTAYLVVMGSAG